MPYEAIRYDVKDSVATLTLNRPEAFNALSAKMAEELFEVTILADEDPGVRVLVLTGAGKAFCSGGDVKGFVELLPQIGVHLKRLTTLFHGAVSRMARMPKPVIGAINGVAAGGGFSLAISCDILVAAESARFMMAYSKIAASPDGSSTYFLPRLVGLHRAMELFYTNRVLTAREAMEWGIVSRVVPDGEFPQAVSTLAHELAQSPTQALGMAKRLFFLSASGGSLETQMEHESQGIAAMGKTADFAEGVRAFAEKRPPIFGGSRGRP